MPSANEQIQSQQILRAAGLRRIENATARALLRLMAALDSEMTARIAELLGGIVGRFTPAELRKAARLRQLEAALADISRTIGKLNKRSYGRIASRLLHRTQNGRWVGMLADLAGHELGIQQQILGGAIQNAVGIVRPSVEHLLGVIEAKPFQGLVLKDWVRDLSAKRLTQLDRAIKLGTLADESIPQIMKRVRGVVDLSRRDAETWTRSAVQHTAGEARDRLYATNADLIKAEVWLATLDSRTCEICAPRDGLEYTVADHKPIDHSIPWGPGPGRIHPQCRCSASAVLKTWQELGIDRQDAPPELRRSVDGTVPAKTTFLEWAANADAERMAHIFGARRAKLLREGKLPVSRLFDERGELFKLSELFEREKRAFKLAGLAA